MLARAKAEAVVDSFVAGEPIDGFILGGDSAFELDGELYGKPHEPENARQRWIAQRGRTGVLHSGHWLIDHRGGEVRGAVGAVSSAHVTFASNFIERIEGDPHAVVGLSVALVRQLMRELGAEWTELWNIERPSL